MIRNLKFSQILNTLQSSYWFLPTVISVGAIALAFITLSIDRNTPSQPEHPLSWLYQGGAEGARAILATVAGSMVTVAATAFSITIVALQLASSNFGPRLLRNFMKDTGNQIVLGTFIATFIYCLLVLRTIYGEESNSFIPQLSVTVGVILAIASIGVLIYFIHHASTIIQVSHVMDKVSEDLTEAIKCFFPDSMGQSCPSGEDWQRIPDNFQAFAYPVKATQRGYLQMIDHETLFKLTDQPNLVFKLQSHPGDFVIPGDELIWVYPCDRLNKKLTEQIQQVFTIGKERSEKQDIVFPMQELVEIALRALSPAVNDPFTAIRCIDHLSAGLVELCQREVPTACRYDSQRRLRIIAQPICFDTLVQVAFDQIRHYGCSDVEVSIRLIQAIARVIARTDNPAYLHVLYQQAKTVLDTSHQSLEREQDYQKVQAQFNQLLTKKV